MPLAAAQKRARSRLTVFTLSNHRVRGAIFPLFLVREEAGLQHGLNGRDQETLAQTLAGAVLLSSTLKNQEKIKLVLQTDGPAQGWIAEATASGEVRGYLFQTGLPHLPPTELYGDGSLTVTRFLEGEKFVPIASTISGKMGNLQADLEHFFELSDQIPSLVRLGKEWAGLIQPLPNCPPEVWQKAEDNFSEAEWDTREAPAGEEDAEAFLKEIFGDDAAVLDRRRVQFFCACHRDRFAAYLKALPPDDKADMKENGPFPVEMVCHYCNSKYCFEREELHALFG